MVLLSHAQCHYVATISSIQAELPYHEFCYHISPKHAISTLCSYLLAHHPRQRPYSTHALPNQTCLSACNQRVKGAPHTRQRSVVPKWRNNLFCSIARAPGSAFHAVILIFRGTLQWCRDVLYKRFLTPFLDDVSNCRQVSDCDRGVLPT